MARGLSDLVAARSQVGNAAVNSALGASLPGPTPRGVGPGPSGWAGRMLLAGQDLVGNQAIANQAALAPPVTEPLRLAGKLVRKPVPPRAKAQPVPAPEVKAPGRDEKPEGKEPKEEAGTRSPGSDPKFQALKRDVGVKKRRIGSSHPPAAAEASAAQAAAVPPADDREARGKAAHAEDMDAAQPGEFDKAAFVRAVQEAIAKRAPKNLDEADKFGESGKADEVKAEVQGKVEAGKEGSAREIADTTAAKPEPAPDTKQVVPLVPDQVPGKPAAPDPALAVPDPLPPSATDLSGGPARVEGQMAAADVTEQQLSFKNSREPAFDQAVQDKKAMDAHSETAPGELRKGEAQEIKQVKATAAAKGTAAMSAIHATRARTGARVADGKIDRKGQDQDKRAQVTALLQKVFDSTKCDVEKILSDLDGTVDKQFTTEEKRARDKFTHEHTEGMREYKRKRYKGLAGKARWVKDLFADLPEEANQIYVRAKGNYLTAMNGVIAAVADTVERELRRAKDRIAAGRKELSDAVDKLPKDLRAIGREAAEEFDGRFDELRDSVNDKGTALVDTLATKYTDAVKAVDAEIAAEKEKNKGLVSKAADKIGGVINTIKELGRLLLGVLRKAATALGAILRDPIGFLGNLVSGVGGGLKLFMKNAGHHLQQGVLAWLLGTGVGAGLQLPTTFDVLGILVMIAGLLGLSWPNIRARLALKVDPRALAAAETGADAIPIVLEARKRGVAGLWSDLKTRVGDLKKDLVGKLVSYLLPTIIIAGVTWIVSLFNPASAFIRACKMIIDIIRFIVTQGRQIIEFVNTVLDAVIAIARGATGGVASLVERALAKSIPVLIGALAAILGVGGIAGKVKAIFQQLARPVNRAIDWVIDKITGLLRKLWAKLKAKMDKRKKPRKPGRPDRRGPARPRRPVKSRKTPPRRRDSRKPRDRRPDDKKGSLRVALNEARRLLADESATVRSVRRQLPGLKRRNRLTSARLVKEGGGRYYIALTVNPTGRTASVPFGYKLAEASASMNFTKVGPTVQRLRRVRNPMKDKHRAGFVVMITAVPGDVKPDIAAKFLTDAWAGSTEEPVAAIRTAVVIGVNSFEPLDPTASPKYGRDAVIASLSNITKPDKLLMAAFGFVWTPRWINIRTRKETRLSTLRKVYNELEPEQKKTAREEEETLRKKSGIPFGLIRGQVFDSSYARRATDILSAVNKQVRSVSQDADSGVMAPEGRGVLAAYDEILRSIRQDRMLIIGGYDFDRFEFAEDADPRTVQLTLLANRIDRAIRHAVGKVHPEMLYPTEPSFSVKLWDEDLENGVFQVLQSGADAAALRELPPYGVGGAEGRRHRKWLKRLLGANFSVVYEASASVSTDPRVQDVGRRLAVTPTGVRDLVTRVTFPREQDRALEREALRKSHAAYSIILQSQSMASAKRLALEFVMANRGLKEQEQAALERQIFVHVEEVVRLMVADPNLTYEDPAIQRRVRRARSAILRYRRTERVRRRRNIDDAMIVVRKIQREIIKALTAPELMDTWRELQRLLREIEHEARQGGTPGVG